MGKGARIKGWIKNNNTGELRSFQFNPTTLSHSRGTTFAEITSPGMPYPLTQYVRGNSREFSVELYVYNAPRSTGYIDNFISFLGGFLPPEFNTPSYSKPPDMTFCYGTFIRKCVLSSLDITYDRLDSFGNPIEAHLNLQLRQVDI